MEALLLPGPSPGLLSVCPTNLLRVLCWGPREARNQASVPRLVGQTGTVSHGDAHTGSQGLLAFVSHSEWESRSLRLLLSRFIGEETEGVQGKGVDNRGLFLRCSSHTHFSSPSALVTR